MARRPKATSNPNPPVSAAALAPAAAMHAPAAKDAPVSLRRGPKPTTAALAKSIKAPKKHGAAVVTVKAATPAADIPAAHANARTAGGYSNQKSKPAAASAMPRRQIAKAAKPEQPFKGKRGRKLRDMTPVAASSPIGAALKGEEATSKAAARWDQATDAVRFDWPAIEQIASRQGPNQGMAKLLVAARAEGANSRWPL